MRSTITRAIADTLNETDFGNSRYLFQKLDTLMWDPDIEQDYQCYVIPAASVRTPLTRAAAGERYWERILQIYFWFTKVIEGGSQGEIDGYIDTSELIIDTVGRMIIQDTIGSPQVKLVPEGIEELPVPEEIQMKHQKITDDNLYSGLWSSLYMITYREANRST